MMVRRFVIGLLLFTVSSAAPAAGQAGSEFKVARENGRKFEEAVAACQRVLKVWMTHADPRTLLLPDRIPGRSHGLKAGDSRRLYTPHNSGADLYPYLILTAHITDPDLLRGRLLEMLRNEIRFTTVQDSIPANLEMTTGELGPPSLEAREETRIRLDYARHRRVLNFDKNYVRLNEFPEWYVVDENMLYQLRDAAGGKERLLLGSELITGVTLKPGHWTLEPLGAPPYARMGTIPPH